MSAFVVSDETTNSLGQAIQQVFDYGRIGSSLVYLTDNEKKAIYTASKDAGSIAKALRVMNCEAVNQRYKEDAYIPIRTRATKGILDDKQFYQAVSCYLYQCNEGDVDTTNLYKTVNNIMLRVARSIADQASKTGEGWMYD